MKIVWVAAAVVLCAGLSGCLVDEKSEIDPTEEARSVDEALKRAEGAMADQDYDEALSVSRTGLKAADRYRGAVQHNDILWKYVAKRSYHLDKIRAQAQALQPQPEEVPPAAAEPVGEVAAGGGVPGEEPVAGEEPLAGGEEPGELPPDAVVDEPGEEPVDGGGEEPNDGMPEIPADVPPEI